MKRPLLSLLSLVFLLSFPAAAVRQIRNGMEGQRFPAECLVIDQMEGLQQNVPASFLQWQTGEDAEPCC